MGRSRCPCEDGTSKGKAVREQLVFLLQLQQSDVKVRELQSAVTQLPAKLDPLRRDLAKLQGMLEAELAEATATRDAARAQVETRWVKIYDTLAAKRGYAVAPVVKGVCQGCHMALPPQLSNILARMESIETCPRCGRLIYRKELLEQPQTEPTKPASDEPKEPKT